MHLTHLGHACLLVEVAESRLLIDPGTFASGFEAVADLDALLVTHQHADHVDTERLGALLAANPAARLLAEPQTHTALSTAEGADPRWEAFAAGAETSVGRVRLRGVGGNHAVIHPLLPGIGNTGLLVSAEGEPTLLHPGDSYDVVPEGVDVLAVPLAAPWAKVAETVDFVRAVAPRQAVPIHDALLQPPAREMYLGHVRRFAPDQTTVLDLADVGRTLV